MLIKYSQIAVVVLFCMWVLLFCVPNFDVNIFLSNFEKVSSAATVFIAAIALCSLQQNKKFFRGNITVSKIEEIYDSIEFLFPAYQKMFHISKGRKDVARVRGDVHLVQMANDSLQEMITTFEKSINTLEMKERVRRLNIYSRLYLKKKERKKVQDFLRILESITMYGLSGFEIYGNILMMEEYPTPKAFEEKTNELVDMLIAKIDHSI
jgi:hypothetical protein